MAKDVIRSSLVFVYVWCHKVTIAGDICGYVYDINDKGLSGIEIC